MQNKIKSPAMQAVLDALAETGTRWHSPAALVTRTKLSLPAVCSALQELVRYGWAIHRRPSASSWARVYSITTTGDQARQDVAQIGMAL